MKMTSLTLFLALALSAISTRAETTDDSWASNRQFYLTRVQAIAADAEAAVRDSRQARWKKALISARLAKLERSFHEQTTYWGITIPIDGVEAEFQNTRSALGRNDFRTVGTIAHRVENKILTY